jgi:hypothetical protein
MSGSYEFGNTCKVCLAIMNLVTLGAKRELLFNKLFSVAEAVLLNI